MQFSMLKSLVAVLAAAAPALAELAVTAPIASTTCRGGQTCQITWNDNGQGVTLAQQGLCTVALYTGGRAQQTFLQPIAWPNAINVATTAAIEFTVDPTVGPNDKNYFIRFSSTNLTQANSTTGAPYLSFSAKFSLEGMTGTFNQTVLDQIAGTATSGSSSAAGSGTTGASTSTSRTGSTTSRSTSTATSTPNGALSNSAGSSLAVAGVAALAGVVALF